MPEFMGPPSWWYEPPTGHEPECNCYECHAGHVESGEWIRNAKRIDFLCCADELDERPQVVGE